MLGARRFVLLGRPIDQRRCRVHTRPSRIRARLIRCFTFVLIKPTHYDDDGYPIQWFRSAMPSNTLACMNSLAEDARKREVLGAGVDIEIETYDETNRRVSAEPDHPRPQARRAGGR